MNPALLLLLTLGICGLIFILWLTVAGLRQRWIEYRLLKTKSNEDGRLSLTVKRRNNFTDTLFRVELISADKTKRLPAFAPGQYLTILIPQEGKTNKLRRSYSLASWQSNPSSYELAIKREESGKGSSWLFDALHPNAIIEAIKPKGSFIISNTKDVEVVLVAGGIGITPLRSMLHYLKSLQSQPSVKLFYASRFRSALCYHEEFEALQNENPWFRYFPILSQPDATWNGMSGRLSGDLIYKHLDTPNLSTFYFCASTEMMDSIIKGLSIKGLAQEQFHFENFAISSGSVSEGSYTINIEGYGDVIYEGVSNIFMALENQDYPINGDCRVGQCGLCKMKLRKGSVQWLVTPEAQCSNEEFLPCICVPKDNLEISNSNAIY